MRALTIRQPFADLIVAGVKPVENRTWRTHYRGLLAIHAARSTVELDAAGLDVDGFVLGAVVGVVELVDVVRGHESEWAINGQWH